ncbi:transmembrane protein 179B [Cololabis saira]|uniref:transmembrane protein 179B n=1 Tax=Cololabis saira TaxID=129043 RepID=UPI002AD3088C|nr:transmembrane protein 179B [Cololabis saira]
MALPVLLLLELALYASCFICGIVTAASVTIVQGNFGGLCMLYGRTSYNATANVIVIQSSSSASLCYFISAISIMVAVVCFSLSLYWLYCVCIEGEMKRERLWMNLIMFVCGIFLFFLLISGCMLKIGRDSLCDSIIHTVHNVTSCEQAQARNWSAPLHGQNFYNNLHKAETAVWVNFFFWLFIGVLMVVHRRQSSESKVIAGGFPAPGGGLFGESDGTAAEREPFVNHPARPQ